MKKGSSLIVVNQTELFYNASHIMLIFQHSKHKIVIYHLRKMATRVKIMDHIEKKLK